MRTKLRNFFGKLLASYWFIPSLMSLASIGASALVLWWNPHGDEGAVGWLQWLNVNTADGARQLLATIAGSTITLAGVIFSITLLALSFASSQYGPRLLRNFMRDRPSQVVLGTFLATYVYSILVLRTIGEAEEFKIPHAAIAGALLLSFASMGVLIFFIHHIARSIQVSSIIAGVGADLDTLICAHRLQAKARPHAAQPPCGGEEHRIMARRSGYVQALAEEDLVAAAEKAGCSLTMHVAPGDYVGFGQLLAVASRLETNRIDAIDHTVRSAIVVGRERTSEQDLEFPIDQLAEIAVRALSPSMNDPFTALQCIGRLGSGLAEIATIPWPVSCLCDADGVARVALKAPSFERLLTRAFSQVLHFGRSNPPIPRQIMKMLAQIAAVARDEYHATIAAHAQTVWRAGQAVSELASSQDFRTFYSRASRSGGPSDESTD